MIDNIHTAYYFVWALDFDVVSHIAFHLWDWCAPREVARNYSRSELDHEWSSNESLWSLDRFSESEEANERHYHIINPQNEVIFTLR